MLNTSTCPVGFLTRTSLNVTEGISEAEALAHELAENIPSSIALATGLLIASLFVLFLGKRLVKPTIFIAAFMGMATLSFVGTDAALEHVSGLSSTASCIVLCVAPLLVGLVAASLALCILGAGFALLGAGAGAGVGYAVYAVGVSRIHSPAVGSYDLAYILCLSIGAILGAVVMCRLRNALLIVATSVLGAAGAAPAILLLVSHAAPHALDRERLWVQAALAALLFLLGLFVQCRHESRAKATHTTALRPAQVPLITP